MQREMADLTRAPPPGISCFPVDGTSLNHLEAHVSGPPGTVYAGGVFKLDVRIPDRCVGAVPGAEGCQPHGAAIRGESIHARAGRAQVPWHIAALDAAPPGGAPGIHHRLVWPMQLAPHSATEAICADEDVCRHAHPGAGASRVKDAQHRVLRFLRMGDFQRLQRVAGHHHSSRQPGLQDVQHRVGGDSQDGAGDVDRAEQVAMRVAQHSHVQEVAVSEEGVRQSCVNRPQRVQRERPDLQAATGERKRVERGELARGGERLR